MTGGFDPFWVVFSLWSILFTLFSITSIIVLTVWLYLMRESDDTNKK